LWDVNYWARLQKKELYGYAYFLYFTHNVLNVYTTFSSYDEVEWSEYFPIDRVLDGLFNLCEQLYGIRILEVPNKANLWHSDVKYYEVLHENEPTIMAGFYLDLSSRLVL
jgi:oligopeptidase A